MLNKEEIENAKNNLLRGNDIESAAIIMEAVIFNNLVQFGGRVNITKIAMRQILNFIDEYKNKGSLEIIREKVRANEKLAQLETEKQKVIDKLEEDSKRNKKSVKAYENMRRNTESEFYKKSYQTTIHKLNSKIEVRNEILSILKGE